MKVEKNKMVAVDYKLTVDGAIADQSQPGAPLEFICGTGMLLPKFEEAILGKEPGEKVAFTLSPKDGYGEVIAEAIVDLPKNTFMVDGKLAEDILFAGSQVPMSDAQGNRMIGTIKEVGEETVKMDFNHPMAGKTLNFEVEVVSVRDVTPEDLQSAGGCSCGCDAGKAFPYAFLQSCKWRAFGFPLVFIFPSSCYPCSIRSANSSRLFKIPMG